MSEQTLYCTCTQMYCTYISVYMYTCTYVYMYMCIYIYTYVCILYCICIYVYMYICIYIYICIYQISDIRYHISYIIYHISYIIYHQNDNYPTRLTDLNELGGCADLTYRLANGPAVMLAFRPFTPQGG